MGRYKVSNTIPLQFISNPTHSNRVSPPTDIPPLPNYELPL